MAKEPFFLSREALYIKVWEMPTVKLAKEFGLSDVAVGKMCRRLDIPKPPLGYWRKIETGTKKNIPPLSKPNDKTQKGVWIYPKSEEKTLQFENEFNDQSLIVEKEISEKTYAELLPENKIKVPINLYKPHPLVAQTQKILSKGSADMYGAVHGKWGEKYLAFRISKKHLNRALRIMDALLKALDKRGCKTVVTLDQQLKTEVAVNGKNIEIALKEDFKRFDRPPNEKKKGIYDSDRYIYEPNGMFTFSIGNAINVQHNWRDGKTSVIEDQLNDIVIGIFRAAEELRQREIQRKNEERKQLEISVEREKNKIIQKRQAECRDLFSELLEKWKKSQELMKFIEAYKTKIIEEKGAISDGSEELHLIEWAEDYAKKLNPILNDRMKEVVGKIENLNIEPTEKDSYEYSHLLWKLKHL